ncbi:MAG: hypothetical protein H0T56_04595 [Pseudaminobacter sp.]|nr:hypothetical protein [Pseudaminobacter sp.]
MESGTHAAAITALTCTPIVIIYLTARRNPFVSLLALLYFVFVQVGLFMFFIGPEFVQARFGAFRLLENVDQSDILETSLIVTVGLVIIAACSMLPLPGEPAGPKPAKIGIKPDYLSVTVLILGAVLGVAFIATVLIPAVGIAEETGSIPDFLTLRRSAGQDYLLILAVFNLLPMCALYLLLAAESNRRLRWLFWSAYLLTTVALFFTFQKRSLIVHLALMAVFMVTLHVYRVGARNILSVKHVARISAILTVPVIALGGLYFIEQNYGRGVRISDAPIEQPAPPPGKSAPPATTTPGEKPAQAKPEKLPKVVLPSPLSKSMSIGRRIFIAGRSVVSRTLGRMALSSVMLVAFVPEHQPHYGLSNVGLLANVQGRDLYNPGGDVFEHFKRRQTAAMGNISTPALIDLYGQFGWAGVVVGSVLIGIGLAVLSWLLRLVRYDRASYLFLLAAGGLAVFYLSQANIFRAALGYGGAIFLLCWAIFFRRSILHAWRLFRREQSG